jgi:hypothetical protein
VNRDATCEGIRYEAEEGERHLAGELDSHRQPVGLKSRSLVAWADGANLIAKPARARLAQQSEESTHASTGPSGVVPFLRQ